MQRVLVLHVADYAFKGDDGKQVEVRKVTLTDGIRIDESDNREQGLQVMELRATEDALGCVKAVPGVYDVVYTQRKKGRDVVLQVGALAFVKPVDLGELVTVAERSAPTANGTAPVAAGR